MRTRVCFVVVLIALVLLPASAYAKSWNLAADYGARADAAAPQVKDADGTTVWYFKHAGNPTTPGSFTSTGLSWADSYGWMPGATGIRGWTRTSTWTHISVNTGADANSNTTPGFLWKSGDVLAHPMPVSDPSPYTVVEWKSPVAGNADVEVSLTDYDAGGGDGFEYWVLEGSSVLKHGTPANGSGATETMSNLALAKDDSIYVVLGPGPAGDHQWDTTKVDFAVSIPDPPAVSTPASGAWTVAILGGLGMAFVVARRRLLATC